MTRKNTKKDEIIANAMALFLEKGYENVSIRDITAASHGQIGMFYHYFSSKDEVFNAAIDLFLRDYEKKFSFILADPSQTIAQRIDLLFLHIENSMASYSQLKRGQPFHWSVETSIRVRTISSLIPSVEGLIEEAVSTGAIPKLDVDSASLASYLSFGVAAVMRHDESQSFSCRKEAALTLVRKTLGVMSLKGGKKIC